MIIVGYKYNFFIKRMIFIPAMLYCAPVSVLFKIKDLYKVKKIKDVSKKKSAFKQKYDYSSGLFVPVAESITLEFKRLTYEALTSVVSQGAGTKPRIARCANTRGNGEDR